MNKTTLPLRAGRLLSLLALVAFSAASLRSENIFVTGYKGTTGTTDVSPSPPCGFTGCSLFGASTTSASTASPTPIIPASSRRVVYGNLATAVWTVTPTDITLFPVSGSPPAGYTFRALQNLGVYKIYVTEGENGNTSTNLLVNLTATGGDLADASGNAATSISLDNFQVGKPDDVWIHVGYITNNSYSPTLTFKYGSGFIGSTGGRWYMDAVWFEFLDPCTGVAPEVRAEGPLAQGQTYVNVSGVVAGATNVTVYANGSIFASTNWPAGFAAGTVVVPTSALSKGAIIQATQTKPNDVGDACSSDPGAGGIVGGGPNAKLTTYLGCWSNATLTGPIGADSAAPSGTVYPYFLKAHGVAGNFNTAPIGGPELAPGVCWQTVTFQNGIDDAVDQNSNAHVTNSNPFCSLESLIFSIADTDTGPYDIYVDSIMNGDIVVEDFESYAVDSVNTFATPNASTVPAVGATYLSAPNSSTISANHAFDGTQSLRIQWQWTTEDTIRWARTAANAATGKRYPQLDTTKPITIRYLVLPVGATEDYKFNGTVSAISNAAPAWTTGTNTLGVTVTGAGTYTYEWTWSGGPLPNPTTNPTYTIGDSTASGLSSADDGTYTVTVSDGTCSESRSAVVTVKDPTPSITNQPVAKTILHVGDNALFSVGASAPVPGGFPLTYQWRFNDADIADATGASYATNNVQVANAGYYTVVVGNTYGSVTSSVATLDVVQPSVVVGTGTGLRGNYYSPAYSTNPFAGPIVLSRIDPTVDFVWGQGATGNPHPSISADYFSVRWSGQVRALDTDTYTFYAKCDDGQRLWVNGQLLVNDWTPHPATEVSGSIALTANQHYNIVMEYFEGAVVASAQLSWSAAGGGVVKEVIPTSQLYPAAATPVSPTLNFSMSDGTSLIFNWGPGTHTLVWATNVTGPYTNRINGVTSPYTNIIGTEPQKFFRLQVLQ